ncbi:HesA/MoeB/ThiF family protein [Candidatus Bathyarchaeota archaeon]|nr:MAG: HesA/MoeB/ThiF family protein [Candidatus Bathyarchaeota archaeon]
MIHFDPEEYYKRQTVLHELGYEGQEKLRHSKVAIIGLGGLGSAAALYLALAGVGHLRLVDQDTVELHNLHRQVLYTLRDLRFPKVEAAAKRVKQINPEVKVDPIPENVRETNVEEIIGDMDCVVDGLDNIRTRHLINRVCVNKKVPYVYGAAIGIEGYLSVFNSPETPCLACVFPNLDDRNLPTCETRGVLGVTTGIIGTMEAMEAVKILAGIGDTLKNTLLVCDFYDMYMAKVDIFKNPKCPVCGEAKPEKGVEVTEQLVWLCGQNTVNVNPRKPLTLSINDVCNRLSKRFEVLLKSSFVVVFEHNDAEVSLFKGGRALIKNVKSEKDALEVYKSVMKHLEAETE